MLRTAQLIAHDQNRTGDLLLTMQMLCRLSYVGTNGDKIVKKGVFVSIFFSESLQEITKTPPGKRRRLMFKNYTVLLPSFLHREA